MRSEGMSDSGAMADFGLHSFAASAFSQLVLDFNGVAS
jgi:hypothetical protein